MHGASLAPQPAPVRARREEPADGQAVPVRRVRQGQPCCGGGLDQVPEDHAALHRDELPLGVDGNRPVQPCGAYDRALAAAGARQLGAAVRVLGGHLHLAFGRRGGRHGRDQLLLGARVDDVGRVADGAVREGAVRVGDRAVGRAIRAGHRVRWRAAAGELEQAPYEENSSQALHCSCLCLLSLRHR